jgi:hypothetical protein
VRQRLRLVLAPRAELAPLGRGCTCVACSWCAPRREGAQRVSAWRVQLKRGGGRWGGPGQVLLDPVTLSCCGNSFDKACIATHKQTNRNAACPMC